MTRESVKDRVIDYDKSKWLCDLVEPAVNLLREHLRNDFREGTEEYAQAKDILDDLEHVLFELDEVGGYVISGDDNS